MAGWRADAVRRWPATRPSSSGAVEVRSRIGLSIWRTPRWRMAHPGVTGSCGARRPAGGIPHPFSAQDHSLNTGMSAWEKTLPKIGRKRDAADGCAPAIHRSGDRAAFDSLPLLKRGAVNGNLFSIAACFPAGSGASGRDRDRRKALGDLEAPARWIPLYSANTDRLPSVVLMSGQRLRRYRDAGPTLKQHWVNDPYCVEVSADLLSAGAVNSHRSTAYIHRRATIRGQLVPRAWVRNVPPRDPEWRRMRPTWRWPDQRSRICRDGHLDQSGACNLGHLSRRAPESTFKRHGEGAGQGEECLKLAVWTYLKIYTASGSASPLTSQTIRSGHQHHQITPETRKWCAAIGEK